jgi:hypothetical protein
MKCLLVLLLPNNIIAASCHILQFVYVQLGLIFTLLFIIKIHYMFQPNWPYSGVQISLCLLNLNCETEAGQLGSSSCLVGIKI